MGRQADRRTDGQAACTHRVGRWRPSGADNTAKRSRHTQRPPLPARAARIPRQVGPNPNPNPNPDQVVGWYSTGVEVNDSSILFHEFYGQEVERPVHLLLDLGLGASRMSCKVRARVGVRVRVSSP